MTEKYDRMDPDKNLSYPPYSLLVNNKGPMGKTINQALRQAGRGERFRVISSEDSFLAAGFWTAEEGMELLLKAVDQGQKILDQEFLHLPVGTNNNEFWLTTTAQVIEVLKEANLLQQIHEEEEKYNLVIPNELYDPDLIEYQAKVNPIDNEKVELIITQIDADIFSNTDSFNIIPI